MNSPINTPGPAGADQRPAIARLIRRICLLREQAVEAEAGRVEAHDFASAVRDYRLAHGAEALPESELQAMFATEGNRVADAVILSELLVPQLIGSLAAPAAGPGRRAAPAAPLREPPPVRSLPIAATAESPAIPALLDAMLADDRARRRSQALSQRQA